MELTRPDGSPLRVLVVDDEVNIAELICDGAALRGLGGRRPPTPASKAVAAAKEFGPDAVVLDMMLPDFDGLEVLRRMRATDPDVPVLFLTARDAVEDRVAGLTAGGDDYVTKPFSLEELVARLRGLMRRAGAQQAATSSVLTVGDLELDEDSHEVCRGGEEITLTATEFELLRFLMRNPRRVLSQGADPRPGLELRLRRPGQRRRALHLLPAQEDRRRPRADDPHHARRGLRAEAGAREVGLRLPHLAPGRSPPWRWSRSSSLLIGAGDDAGDALLPHRPARPRRAGLAGQRASDAPTARPGAGPATGDRDRRGPGRRPHAGTLTAASPAPAGPRASAEDAPGDAPALTRRRSTTLDRGARRRRRCTTSTLPGLGELPRRRQRTPDGDVVVAGLPTADVDDAGRPAGLAGRSLLGAARHRPRPPAPALVVVRRQLRPLREVAADRAHRRRAAAGHRARST